MQTRIINPQLIQQNGWRQGAFFLEESNKVYADLKLKENVLYVVLSHDCDILNPSLQKEPVVELLEATRVESNNPDFYDGRNPRQLHLAAKIFNDSKWLEFFPNDRLFLPREYLEELKIFDCELDSRELRILINWISKRYKRAGFPSQFNHRTSGSIKQIKNILGQEAKKSLGLFIRLHSEDELDEDEKYKIIIKMLVNKNIYENNIELTLIENGFEKIINILTNNKGIEIIAEETQVISMDEITVHEYQELKKWDFDYISFLNSAEGEILDS